MEEGLLSLKWNNHKSTFFQVLSALRQKQTFTDVTLSCEDRLYPAHKFVLSACSEYFSNLFGSIVGNLVVVLKDVRRTDLEYLLDYMYLGQVDVAQSELSSLIKTAECLRIKGLAIPDDEPHKTKARSSEEHREGSPPAKKKRHLPADDDRGSGSSLSGASSSSAQVMTRIHLDPLPPPQELNSLVQRLRQPSPHTPQTTPTTPQTSTPQPTSKPHPAPLTIPHTTITSQESTSSGSPTVSAPPLPVIKQEAVDPSDAPDVFESFEDGDTKPDVSDGVVAGPSGLQGASDTWDGESDMGGFAGGGGGTGSSGGGGGVGEGYTEAGLDEPGDAEVQGEALLCEGCSSWQHRTCGTGITREQYRTAVRTGQDIDWLCHMCNYQQAQNISIESPEEAASTISVCSVNESADNNFPETQNITYEKVCTSTQRGKHKLVDSLGYSYTLKRQTNASIHWRCAVRNKSMTCKMTIKEVENTFIRGHSEHCHPPEACPAMASKVSMQMVHNK